MAQKLKIGGHQFKLILSPMAEDDCGETDYGSQEIRISTNIAPTQRESTLIHEAMHGMNTTMDHEFLDSLAEQVYQFLKDNNLFNEKRLSELLH